MIYVDNAATTKISDSAFRAMNECFTFGYGNPSSIHTLGRTAKKALERSRESIARLIGANPDEVYFTSGGTESANWAINAAVLNGANSGKRHIVSSRFEHKAVLNTLNKIVKQGFEITLLDVHSDGLVRPDELEVAIRDDTALVTIMYVNNEIGTIQPISELSSVCRQRAVIFHTDAAQAAGHICIDVQKDSIDMLSISAHKFHGPKGIGVLYCRKGVQLPSMIEGGAQENGLRGGTENVPGVVGMAAAIEESYANFEEDNELTASMSERLIDGLLEIPRSRLNGNREKRLSSIMNFSFEDVEGEHVLNMLDQVGIYASSGSACTAGFMAPSHVLLALGMDRTNAHEALRISLCRYNTTKDIETIIDVLPPIVERLRHLSPLQKR